MRRSTASVTNDRGVVCQHRVHCTHTERATVVSAVPVPLPWVPKLTAHLARRHQSATRLRRRLQTVTRSWSSQVSERNSPLSCQRDAPFDCEQRYSTHTPDTHPFTHLLLHSCGPKSRVFHDGYRGDVCRFCPTPVVMPVVSAPHETRVWVPRRTRVIPPTSARSSGSVRVRLVATYQIEETRCAGSEIVWAADSLAARPVALSVRWEEVSSATESAGDRVSGAGVARR
jgi:hypothetical protein